MKSTIRTYYGATDPDNAGISSKNKSPYISEMKSIARSQWRYLDRMQKNARKHHKRPAIVLDADDTTLWTYDMEDAVMHFNFDPVLQNTWVQDELFPATPAMVGFVNRARQRGFKIFGLIGGHADRQVKLPNPTYYLP